MEKNRKFLNVALDNAENSARYAELYARLGFCNQTECWNEILLKHLTGKEPIQILGAGTGSLAVPLSEKGWRITAVEMNDQVFSTLKENSAGRGIFLHRGRFQDYQPPPVSCYGILAPSCLITCFGEKQLADFFKYTKAYLHEDGVACFEITRYNFFNAKLSLFPKQELSFRKINETTAEYSISYLFDDRMYTDSGSEIILSEEMIKKYCKDSGLHIVGKYPLTLVTEVYAVKKHFENRAPDEPGHRILEEIDKYTKKNTDELESIAKKKEDELKI